MCGRVNMLAFLKIDTATRNYKNKVPWLDKWGQFKLSSLEMVYFNLIRSSCFHYDELAVHLCSVHLLIYLFIIYYWFDCNYTTAAIFLFRIVSTEQVTLMKISSKTENQLLRTTASAIESSVQEKGVAGYSPRYSSSKKKTKHPYLFQYKLS